MRGTQVILYEKREVGVDALNVPIYEESPVVVNNVLIGQPSPQDTIDALQLHGAKIVFTLGIPKGDTHDWNNVRVSFWGEDYMTVGIPSTGQQELIPGAWGKNVQVERYV